MRVWDVCHIKIVDYIKNKRKIQWRSEIINPKAADNEKTETRLFITMLCHCSTVSPLGWRLRLNTNCNIKITRFQRFLQFSILKQIDTKLSVKSVIFCLAVSAELQNTENSPTNISTFCRSVSSRAENLDIKTQQNFVTSLKYKFCRDLFKRAGKCRYNNKIQML